ncbi:MAG: alpha/beta hydrolase [Alphaproteobacteria bacterium]|nr:alpha/beta hydrolase [Alphaproteobacteria bacterium]
MEKRHDLTRRTVLGVAVVSAAAPALAQIPGEPDHVKGPRVFLDYDQAELDAAYDQSVYAPNQAQITGRYATNSDVARSRLGPPKTAAYGPTPVETLDVYRTKKAKAPVLIFIHGGAWRGGKAKDYGFAAEAYVHAGAHYVVPDFAWVQDVGGDLATVVGQVRRAVAWVYKNAASFGGDPQRVYVAGHSSGGHLAGVLLTTDWQKEFGLPSGLIKGGVCGSGMYELHPVSLSARSRYVKFTEATIAAFSSQRHLDLLTCPVSVVYGTFETPEFQRQNREFAAAVKAAGKPVKLTVAPGYNHFEVMETLANPYGFMGHAALAQMKLTAG